MADAYGRFPAVFIDFGSYRERVKTAGNTQLWDTDHIPNPAPTDPAEGVAETELLQTGMFVFEVIDGTRTGFVRANGRTIGSATSGASERANADCEDLYERLYNALDNTAAPVSGGRGANAAADFAANKTLTLPDLRGRSPFGLETMGASAAGRMSSIVPGYTASTNATLPGYAVGLNTHQLTVSELATVTPSGTIAQITPAGTIGQITPAGSVSPSSYTPAGSVSTSINGQGAGVPILSGSGFNLPATGSMSFTLLTAASSFTGTPQNFSFSGTPFTPVFTGTPFTPAFTGTPFGSNAAHNNVPNAVLGTWYIKL